MWLTDVEAKNFSPLRFIQKGHWTFCPVAFFYYCGIISVKLYSSAKHQLKKKGENMQIPTPQDKFAEFDARLARIEGIVEQMDKRMSSVELRLTNLESRVDSGFRWVIGLLITLLIANVGTAITIILTLNK